MTDIKVRSAKPQKNKYTLVDWDGMFYSFPVAAKDIVGSASALAASSNAL